MFTLGIVHCMGLDRGIMTYIYHYIIQSIFTALKMLCALCLLISLPQPLVTTDLLIVSMILPFPDVIKLESRSTQPFHIDFFHLVILM